MSTNGRASFAKSVAKQVAENRSLPKSESRPCTAFRLKMKGYTATETAKLMRVSERTVYRLLKEYVDESGQSLIKESATNLVAELLAELEEMQRVSQRDAARCTGMREKHSHRRLALQALQTKIELLMKTGIIPMAATQLHMSVEDKHPATKKEPETKRTREEMMQIIIDMVEQTPTLPGPSAEELATPLMLADKSLVDL